MQYRADSLCSVSNLFRMTPRGNCPIKPSVLRWSRCVVPKIREPSHEHMATSLSERQDYLFLSSVIGDLFSPNYNCTTARGSGQQSRSPNRCATTVVVLVMSRRTESFATNLWLLVTGGCMIVDDCLKLLF
jgi:hypothetical protein